MKKRKANLKVATAFAQKVAIDAGEKLKYYRRRLNALKVSSKKAQGVVSNADIESEQLIIKALSKTYPEIEILAE
jgi:fructose-1,6-bisphosphatase/inositol monophosphatase family enzyme